MQSVAAPAVRILVVEDSKIFTSVIRRELSKLSGAVLDFAASYAEARNLIEAASEPYRIAVLDIVLPDSKDGEIVELCKSAGISSIVFTSIISNDIRERMMALNVVDYIAKDNPTSMSMLFATVNRLLRNRNLKALAVDDSAPAREIMKRYLEQYGFHTLTAANGREAMEVLRNNLDLRLVVTDLHMPEMDGIEMIKAMRVSHSRDRLAIVGISSGGGSGTAARFIKNGANDFITKPFLPEEFFFRISQNMEMLDLVAQIRDSARRDFLTGLHNRRYLSETGLNLFAGMRHGRLKLSLAMIDIDHFKKINDQYGHDAGDEVLVAVARRLDGAVRETDVVVRMGGEEFCVLLVNYPEDDVIPFFDRLRARVAATPVGTQAGTIPVSVSIGVCDKPVSSLEETLTVADAALYEAKAAGRNRVVMAAA